MELREFLYLDEDLLDQFLSQIDSGLVRNESIASTEASSKGGKFGIRGVSGNVDADSSSQVSYQRILTPEANFNRLYPHLEAENLSSEKAIRFDLIKRSRFMDVDCEISIPLIGKFLAQSEEFSALGEVLKTYSVESRDDSELLEGLSQIQTIGRLAGKPVIGLGYVNVDDPKFVFKLDRKFLKVDFDDIECEAHVVGKVESKWVQGVSHSLINIPGMNLLNRKTRRQIEKQQQDQQPLNEEIEIEGPAVSLRVLAIYR